MGGGGWRNQYTVAGDGGQLRVWWWGEGGEEWGGGRGGETSIAEDGFGERVL